MAAPERAPLRPVTTLIPVDGPRLCRLMEERGLDAATLGKLAQVGEATIRKAMKGGARCQPDKVRRMYRAISLKPPDPDLLGLMSREPPSER